MGRGYIETGKSRTWGGGFGARRSFDIVDLGSMHHSIDDEWDGMDGSCALSYILDELQ